MCYHDAVSQQNGGGNDLLTNRHCMAPFLQAHEAVNISFFTNLYPHSPSPPQCITQSITNCFSGYSTAAFCSEPNYQYDDWLTAYDVDSAYPISYTHARGGVAEDEREWEGEGGSEERGK